MNEFDRDGDLDLRPNVGETNGAASTGLSFAQVLLRRRRIIFLVPALFFVAAYGLTRVKGATYTAESRFVRHTTESSASPFASLAMQYGLNVGRSSTSESPDFYAELLKSRELLRSAVTEKYRVARTPKDTIEGTIVELYKIEGPTQENRIHQAVVRVAKHVTASPQLRTGLLELKVSTPWPDLSIQLNRKLLTLVNDFNLRQRQNRAAAERRFVDARLNEARSDLNRAEQTMAAFMERNKRWQASDRLSLEQAQLERRVQMAQQIYVSLVQAHEQASIDELKNIPLITIVEQPIASARYGGLGPMKNGIWAAMLGLFLALMLAFAAEAVARLSVEHPEQFAEFRTQLRSATPRVLGRNGQPRVPVD